MALPNQYPMPGPTPGPTPPGYGDVYPVMGLSGLAQGFTHGLELGHQWGEKADELTAKKDQMANEAAWRESQAKQAADWHTGELKNQKDHLDWLKNQALNAGNQIKDENGNIIGVLDAHGKIVKTSVGKAANQKDIDAANAALVGLENMKSQVHGIGFGKNTMTSVPMALWNGLKSHIGGTQEDVYKSETVPTMMVTAHDLSNRFSMPELPAMLEGTGGFNNTEASALHKINAIEEKIRAKAGIAAPSGDGQGGSDVGPTSGGRVNMFDPSGKPKNISASDLKAAIAAGWKQAS